MSKKDALTKRAEELHAEYLKAGGGGVLGTVDYFREVAEFEQQHDENERELTARPLANLTAQQFSDYCGSVDADALSGEPDETALAVGEICVDEVNARKALKRGEAAA